MNKLRLSFFKSLGGDFVAGDKVSFKNTVFDIVSSFNRPLFECSVIQANASQPKETYIDSFAPRNNTGEQPMPDGFPVVAYMRSINMLAIDWHWSIENNPVDIATWKPDIDALIALQDEHDKADKPVCLESLARSVSDAIVKSNVDVRTMNKSLCEDLYKETIPTFSIAMDKGMADFTVSNFSAGYMEAVKAGFTFDKFCKAGVDFNKVDKNMEVITDPANIAEYFERDQEADDKQLDSVASALRNAGYFVQVDMIKFMQDEGLLNEVILPLK